MLPIDYTRWNNQPVTVYRVARLPLGLAFIVLAALLWLARAALDWMDGKARKP